jgi:hypothetical protein
VWAKNRPCPQRRLAVASLRRLTLRFDGWAVLPGTDAEEQVYLVLVQWPVAGCRSHHEFTDQLDLGLQVIICEVVILSFAGLHVSNLPGPDLPAQHTPGWRPELSAAFVGRRL